MIQRVYLPCARVQVVHMQQARWSLITVKGGQKRVKQMERFS